MIDEDLVEQLNRGYVCPSDPGPAWRAASQHEFDMSLVESMLSQTLGQRLEPHQRMLDMVLELNPTIADAAER